MRLNKKPESDIFGWEIWEVIILVYVLLGEYLSSFGHHALRKTEFGGSPGESDKSD